MFSNRPQVKRATALGGKGGEEIESMELQPGKMVVLNQKSLGIQCEKWKTKVAN